jgi:hypothetical protein
MDTDTSVTAAESMTETGGGSDEHSAGGALTASDKAATVTAVLESQRMEVSASTVTRMLGIATSSDLRLLEGRLDLLTAKLAGVVTKLDRLVSLVGAVPTAADIDRLEVQIGSLKSLVREVLEQGASTSDGGRTTEGQRSAAQEQSRKLREGIKTSPPEADLRPKTPTTPAHSGAAPTSTTEGEKA